MDTSQGYQCEFVEVVPEDLYCRKCSLVARRLTITDCCGESFCHNCIAGPQQQNQPCPACGENNFNTFKQVKHLQASEEPEKNQPTNGVLQNEGERLWLVRDTGAAGHSLGPSPGQLPVCGHQVSPQLPKNHPQEQPGRPSSSTLCQEGLCLPLLLLQSHLRGGSRRTLASVQVRPLGLSQQVWSHL